MLGDLNANIQSQNPRSQKVAEIFMEFGLVELRHHLGRSDGSDTVNVVSDSECHIFGVEGEYRKKSMVQRDAVAKLW